MPEASWLAASIGVVASVWWHRVDFGIDVSLVCWGWSRWLGGRRTAARSEELEAEVESFLRRLKQLLGPGRSSGYALEMAISETFSDEWPLGREGPDPWPVLLSRWPFGVVRSLAQIWKRADRHGGDLAATVGQLLSQLRQERQERRSVALETEAKRSSVVILGVAVPAALVGMHNLLPAYFHLLVTTPAGAIALTWIALSEAGVFWALGRTAPGGGL